MRAMDLVKPGRGAAVVTFSQKAGLQGCLYVAMIQIATLCHHGQ